MTSRQSNGTLVSVAVRTYRLSTGAAKSSPHSAA